MKDYRKSLPIGFRSWRGLNIFSHIFISDANINVQMNYWMAEQLGLNLTQSLWDYMEVGFLHIYGS